MNCISLLSKNSLAFLSNTVSAGKSRSKEASIALARVIAYKLPLPSTEVTDIKVFLNTQYVMPIEIFLCKINEMMIINFDEIKDYIYKFYEYRYLSVYPEVNLVSFSTETAIEDFFRISKIFDKVTIETIKASPIEMMRLINGFRIIAEELKEKECQ